MIDISVPRNIDPRVNEIENAYLYDIDDLQSVISSNLKERGIRAKEASIIIEQAVEIFENLQSVRNVGPLVSGLRKKIETICLDELDKSRNGFTSQEFERIQRMMIRTAHRIAHPLMVQIKRGHENPTRRIHNLDMIKEAFELKETEE
jgi:glutamyl-tRNA reductase